METPKTELRRGWTTGACATAAVKAALMRLWGGAFPEAVTITLPKGETPTFPLAHRAVGEDWAEAGITKDAGDDPDVTHGALIIARVREAGTGISFRAGEGVGTVTKPGLPIPPGEPAINPVPREMMVRAAWEAGLETGRTSTGFQDVSSFPENRNSGKPENRKTGLLEGWASAGLPGLEITVSIPGGKEIAAKTWNPRLGIEGGLSVLGTTGIVRPFSCSAWIASIHRGVDVARAAGLTHVAGCTGATSERAVQALYVLPDHAMLDMGDFAGGMLKYLVKHPVPRVTIGGGIGKLTKLAQGAVDLHSRRSQVDFDRLADLVGDPRVAKVNTALEAYELIGKPLADAVAEAALAQVRERFGGEIAYDIVIVDREGAVIARAGP